MKFLGKYSPNGDIILPIQAEDSGLYFFIEIGQNDAEIRKINLEVTAGNFITVPNVFQENDFISFKIKKRNRRLIYHENESKFSLLIDREDNVPSVDVNTGTFIEILTNNTLRLTSNTGQVFEVTFDAQLGLFGQIRLLNT